VSPTFVSAADLAPGAVLSAEEEVLWRLGETYELRWVEGREVVSLHLIGVHAAQVETPGEDSYIDVPKAAGFVYVRPVGVGRKELLPEVARAWTDSPRACSLDYYSKNGPRVSRVLHHATLLDLEKLPGYPRGLPASSPRRAGLHALGKPAGKRKSKGGRGTWRSARRG